VKKSAAVIIAAATVALGCGEEQVDREICSQAQPAMDAIMEANLRPDFREELLDDIRERAAEANCPGYEDDAEEE
jgi:hypothetical protein